MTEVQQWLIQFFTSSPLREASAAFLRSVPGLPPILQTVHLLGLAVLMASAIMINLRILNLACRRQQLQEMMQRLFPWVFWVLPVMLVSGLPFFLARPQRYLTNPIFGLKLLFLLAALVCTCWLWRRFRAGAILSVKAPERILATTGLSAWLLTALAGRWIAYADYIFWPG